MRTTSVRVALLGVGLLMSPAAAQVTYTSQTRALSAFAWAGLGPGETNQSSAAAAGGFEPFNVSISAATSVASAAAFQNSIFAPDHITTHCRTSAYNQNNFPANSECIMVVSFFLEQDTPYVLSGDFSFSGIGWVRLVRASGASLFSADPGAHGTVNQQGVLVAGSYTLDIKYSSEGSSSGDPPPSLGSMVLTIPPPASSFALLLAGGMGLGRRRR
jgi:hypothetical protein